MLRLMCCMAHPDDETLGTGGIIARYTAEGIETYLITATRGERGWTGTPETDPGLQELGTIRTTELHNAASVLGIKEVNFLDYLDGDLDQADPEEATRKIVGHIRRIRPHVVITFDSFGAYGHPDHIAISQLTTGAIVAAASPDYMDEAQQPPHQVQKLYFMAGTDEEGAVYEDAFGKLIMTIDGQDRGVVGWPSWSITTDIDTAAYWPQVWKAVQCHRSQLSTYHVLENLSAEQHQQLWGQSAFYRVFSLVNGGRQVEDDLFAGLR
ncbi:MAG: PIG-L family deacetylase [Candidatus Promineifilaceae bacterium]